MAFSQLASIRRSAGASSGGAATPLPLTLLPDSASGASDSSGRGIGADTGAGAGRGRGGAPSSPSPSSPYTMSPYASSQPLQMRTASTGSGSAAGLALGGRTASGLRPAASAIGLVPSARAAGRLHFLVVDDDATNRRLAARMLERLGCSCLLLEDGDFVPAALERTGQLQPEGDMGASPIIGHEDRSPLSLGDADDFVDDEDGEGVDARGRAPTTPSAFKRFDAILLDQVMVRSTGSEVCALIRSRGCTVPVFAMTANTSTADLQRYVSAGMSEFVVAKPFSIGTLRSVVEMIVEGKAASAAAPTGLPAAGAGGGVGAQAGHIIYGLPRQTLSSPKGMRAT